MSVFRFLPPSVSRLRRPPALAYASDERPPAGTLLALGLQHAATALVLVAYVLVAGHQAGLQQAAIGGLVTTTVLGMAIATFLQAWGGRVGAGALIVHIPSPVMMVIAVAVLSNYGPGGMVAAALVSGGVALLVAQVVPRLRSVFPPSVAGVVVVVTGLSLAAPAVRHTIELSEAGDLDGQGLLVGIVTLAVIVALSVWGAQRLKLFALLAGVLSGIATAAALGRLPGADALAGVPQFGLPTLVTPVFSVDPGLLVAVALLSLMTPLGALGTIVLMHKMDDADWRRADMRMVAAGVRAGALGNILGGLMGAYPTATSSANVALAHISRSTSRYVGIAAALLLAALAFLPKWITALTLIPTPVIGAVELYAAAYLVVSGVELIASRAMDTRTSFVVGLSIICGIAVVMVPALPRQAPHALRFLAENGIIVSGVVAIALNLLFRLGSSQRAVRTLAPLPPGPEGRAPTSLAETIVDFVETQGAAWGARRDVVHRAAAAALEAAEAIAAAGQGRAVQSIRGSFDEFNLDIELQHSGPRLILPAAAPASAPADLLDGEDEAFQAALEAALSGVSAVLLHRLADRLIAGDRGGQAYFRLHFDH